MSNIDACRMKFEFASDESNHDTIKPSSDDQIDSVVGSPSILVPHDMESLFYRYFSRCPVTLYLTNITIKSLSDDSVERSFVNNVDLSQWLTQHDEQHQSIKYHVKGNINGKLADIMNNTRMTNLSLSFDCSLSCHHLHSNDMVDDNISPHRILIHVNNSSIVMRALLKLTDAAVGIPMVANAITDEVAEFTIDKSLCDRDIVELNKQTVDIKEFTKYHHMNLSRTNDTFRYHFDDKAVDKCYPHPCFISRRDVATDVSDNKYKLKFHQSHVITQLDVLVATPDELTLSSSMVLGICCWSVVIESKDGNYVSHRGDSSCNIRITWQKHEAPPALWALKTDAIPYTPDLSALLAHPDTTRVDRWRVENTSTIFRKRFLEDEQTSEEVTAEFDMPCENSVYEASFIIDTKASIAPYIYDKLFAMEKVNDDQAPLAEAAQRIVEPFMSRITHHFPTLKMDDNYVSSVRMMLQSSPSLSVKPMSSKVEISAFLNDVDVVLTSYLNSRQIPVSTSYLNYRQMLHVRTMQLDFVEATEISIEQMLMACNQSSILSHMPRKLLSARLHSGSISIRNGHLVASGKFGSNKLDRFLLLHCISKDARHASTYNTFIQIYHRKLISPHTFHSLQKFGSGDAQHRYIFLDASQPVSVSVDYSLNDRIRVSDPGFECSRSKEDPFAQSVIIPVGSHFFTIKQQKSMQWTLALDMDTIEDEPESMQASKRAKLNDTANVAKFNIPLALLTNPRSSADLAQHVFEFVSVLDVLFGINMLEHAQHDNVVLLDDKWWKRRLTSELGSHVSRWPDNVLRSWQQQWLEGKPWHADNQKQHLNPPATEADRQRVMSQPLWFNAAVHLATRLKTFACDILCQSDGNVRMPAAMRYVLTVAPPFQLCIQELDKGQPLWFRARQVEFDDLVVSNNSYHWFSRIGDDEGTSFISLYTGTSYLISDDKTVTLGEAVIDAEKLQDEEWVEEYYKGEDGLSVREVVLTDPDFWPVVDWQAHQSEIEVGASNLHEYFKEIGTYRYCDELHVFWDKQASSIASRSAMSLTDRCVHENAETEGKDLGLLGVYDPHQSLAPSHCFRFSRRYMSGMLQQLVDEVGELDDESC